LETNSNYLFCYDLSWNATLSCYLPVAYIINNTQKISYIDKKATPEVIQSFGISEGDLDNDTKKILSICEWLKPEFLYKKYNKNNKSKKSIADLLQDSKIAFGINQYIQLHLNNFLHLIVQNRYPLSINLGNNKEYHQYQIAIDSSFVEAQLNFNQHENGITYTLLLKENESSFYPSDKNILLLLDDPSWLVIEKKLSQLKEVNSKKIIPFLKKKTIEIPTKMIGEYFEKFIKDIVKKVDIEATGFDIAQKSTIKNCAIQPVHDFFKNKYYLNLLFDYDGYSFDNLKPKKTHSEIDVQNIDSIKVIQYKRSKKEIEYENKLLEIGFVKTENHLFALQKEEDKNDPFEFINWIIDHQEAILHLGFSIDNLKIDNKKLTTNKTILSFSNALINDWFDVKMTVTCGSFTFSFTEIIPHIKNKNRLYLLPDDTYFIIPIEWLHTYEPIIRLSKIENGSMLLPKSNFALVEAISNTKVLPQSENIDYKSSPLVKATLRPYQETGVKWLLEHYNNNLGACLADDMGLGKTLQTLATLVAIQERLGSQEKEVAQLDLFSTVTESNKEYLKVLIILPSSLIFNWYNEARKFTPHFRRIQYIGNNRKSLSRKLDQYDLIFTSYAIASRDINVFEKFNFRYLILDESQYIKNKNSKIFKAVSQIKAAHKISLSGTPIENSLDDLWSQMQFINPNILGNYTEFVENYKNPIQKKNDETALLELKKIIAPFILRRTKEEVLTDLPPVSEQVFYCEMETEQEKLYEEEKSKARNYLLKTDGSRVDKINIINTLMRLRQLSNHPKMIDTHSEIDSGKYMAVTNYLQTLIEANQKVLIFSSFVSNLGFYKEWCTENNILFCELTGATSLKERESQVAAFQNNEKPLLFFISLKAGGVGLNITRASYVLFLDPWWNPFAEKQGISRAHRIGQLNKVNVVRFISKNTVEEKIIHLQESKKLLSDSLLHEDFLDSEIEENLGYILG
jgi:SNF2 family DNA or RNA helicase